MAAQADVTAMTHPGSLTRCLSPTQLTVAIGVLWLAVNAIWLYVDQRPPTWDDAFHATLTLKTAQALSVGSVQALKQVWLESAYPPLTYLVCAPAGWISQHVDILTIWMNVVFGALLATSLLGMATWFEMPWVGVGAMVLTLCQALTVMSARAFLLDFPLAAMVTFAYWRVLACDRCWTRRNGLLLGLAIGLGLLIKWPFALYLAPAILWLAARRLRAGNLRANWRPAALIVGVGFLVSGWWYLWRWPDVLAHARHNLQWAQMIEGDPRFWSGESWMHYLRIYYHGFGTIVPCAALAGGTALMMWRGTFHLRSMVLWLIAGYVLVTIPPTANLRYLYPLVPFMAFVTWAGLRGIPHSFLRRCVSIAITVWCLLQFGVLSSHQIDRALGPWRHVFDARGIPVFHRTTFQGLPAPPTADGVTEALVAHMAASPPVRVLVLVDDPFHNHSTLRYEAFRQGVDLQIVEVLGVLTDEELRRLGDGPYDYVVYREPDYGHGLFPHVIDNIERLTQRLQLFTKGYRRVAQFPIPSGGTIQLYAPVS